MTTIAQPTAQPTSADAAHGGRRSLAESLSSMRTSTRKFTLEGLFLTIGALCLPIGIVTIVLGWYGAAHTGHLYEQNGWRARSAPQSPVPSRCCARWHGAMVRAPSTHLEPPRDGRSLCSSSPSKEACCTGPPARP
jgi:hypothetical protein